MKSGSHREARLYFDFKPEIRREPNEHELVDYRSQQGRIVTFFLVVSCISCDFSFPVHSLLRGITIDRSILD